MRTPPGVGVSTVYIVQNNERTESVVAAALVKEQQRLHNDGMGNFGGGGGNKTKQKQDCVTLSPQGCIAVVVGGT